MKDDVNLEETVKVYLKIRDAIAAMEKRHKDEMDAIKEQYEVVGNTLLDFCNSQNLDSVKTQAGTISRRVSQKYWTSDWDSLYRIIAEHNAPYLLEQRIHQGNMRQFIEENPESFPPGLNSDSKYTVQVRKPTTK